MVEKAVRIRPDDFGALYKVLVSARLLGNSDLEPWELAFEEKLDGRLARMLAGKNIEEAISWLTYSQNTTYIYAVK